MVYKGPSAGCKICRIRRVKCDRATPSCNNCLRLKKTCPGYGDVFDGAHRSQNEIIRRQSERQNYGEGDDMPTTSKSAPSKADSLKLVPSTSSSSTVTIRGQTSQHWIVYSAPQAQCSSLHDVMDLSAAKSPAAAFDLDLNVSTKLIPPAIRQNAQDASICFFFRHYGGTAFDPEASNGFNQLWQPMYLQASDESSLRLATAAVTINIAMLWSSRGCDTQHARTIFTKAVAATREALLDPLKRSTDEVLMTILIFDLYDALVLHYTAGLLDYGKHKHGALAMVEHRNFANLATSRGRTLIGAVRHSLLPYLLSSRQPFPKQLDHLFGHPSINDTKASNLDLISIQLSRVQGHLWTLRRKRRFYRSIQGRRKRYDDIIAEASGVETLLLDWKANITSHNWQTEYIPRESVLRSIQDAGFYGTRCSVWKDLSLGGMWILFSIRYLYTLQVIRQCFADEACLLDNPEHQALLSRANENTQNLVDFICDAIPFHLGDAIIPRDPTCSISVNFPYKFKLDLESNITTYVPSLESNHQKRAAASGGWMLFPQLVTVWRFAEPEDDAVAIVLREGQLEWIKGQVRRLQRVFLFSEPVLFKRLKR